MSSLPEDSFYFLRVSVLYFIMIHLVLKGTSDDVR